LERIYHFLGVSPSARGKVIEEKVHARSGDTIPASIAVRLASYYHDNFRWLHEKFGGYASFWRYCAEYLIKNEPTEPIPYPMWNSNLWEEWGGDAKLRSAPLSTARKQ
jgi:hypothetical protein